MTCTLPARTSSSLDAWLGFGLGMVASADGIQGGNARILQWCCVLRRAERAGIRVSAGREIMFAGEIKANSLIRFICQNANGPPPQKCKKFGSSPALISITEGHGSPTSTSTATTPS